MAKSAPGASSAKWVKIEVRDASRGERMSKSRKRQSKTDGLLTAKKPSQTATRWHVPGVCFVLALITFAVFGQTLHHKFIDFDDNEYVYEIPVVTRGLTIKGIAWAFAGAHAHNWHPLTWLSH